MKGILASAVITSGLLTFTPASIAAVFDFQAWIDVNGEKGFYNDAPFTMTDSGLTLTAKAFETPGMIDSHVYMDDCVEFSFDPDNTERTDYRFSINAAGALFDRYGWDRRKNFKCEYKSKVFPDRGYWACEFAIAAKDLDERVITNESIWGMNVMRTRISVSEKSAIQPTFGTRNVSAFPLAICPKGFFSSSPLSSNT